METLDAKTIIELSGFILNAVIIFMNSKIRADISDLKIWVLENFERRKDATVKVA